MPLEKILVVDDEATIRKIISSYLVKEGYTVVTACDAATTFTMVKQEKPDLILLDIIMPDLDGIETCRELRKEYDIPIIFLTAKDKLSDKVLGLGIGGDDYIIKPFEAEELVARVKAHLRRNRLLKAAMAAPSQEQIIKYPGIEIDLAGYIVQVDGIAVNLTATEFALLTLLAQNPNKILSPQRILKQIWNYDDTQDDRTLMVHISNLRKKIEQNPAIPKMIITIRGAGYKFIPTN